MSICGATYRTYRGVKLAVPLVALMIGMTACGPSAAPSSTGNQTQAATSPQEVPRAPKTLNIVLQEEPVTLVAYGRLGEGGNTTSRYERFYQYHAQLTMFAADTSPVPWAATKIPSLDDGDWKVNPDGSMEVIWQIRPDAYWHDGQPLTAEDFVFGLEVVRDPKLAVPGLGELAKISALEARGPKTLAVHWRSVSVNANTNSTEGIPAIPRHQVEELYRTSDAEAFAASQVWRTEFIGLGPYKLSSWALGSGLVAEAFDRYFLGRPKIDRLLFQYAPDPQVLTARILAGTVDLVPPGTTIKPEQMVELQRQWGPNAGVITTAPSDLRVLNINARDPGVPWADPRFRQAMLHALNRPEMAQVLQYGWTQVSHYFGFAADPIYRLAEQRNLPKYEYDPTRAQQLLAAAGWTKAADGLLHNSAGQVIPTFTCCRYSTVVDSNDIRESLAIGEALKAVGIDAQHPVQDAPAGMAGTEMRRFRALSGYGATFGNFRVTPDQYWATYTVEQIPTESNRWQGLNTATWQDPTYEETFSRAQSTLNLGQRNELQFQLMKSLMEQLPALPTYYNPLGLVYRKGLEGVGTGIPLNRGIMWDIHLWDLKS